MPNSALAASRPELPPQMLHIGLTGNIASGKSTVSRMLAERGATIIDADVLAREAVAPGTPGLQAVHAYFGDDVMLGNGSLNREALRRLVFNNPVARDALNQIVHPVVASLRERALQAARARGARIVISDIPLLFETGLEHSFDAVIFVDAPESVRLARIMEHRALPEADARAMMIAQWPAAEKRGRSTFVVDNNGTLSELAEQVAQLWHKLELMTETR